MPIVDASVAVKWHIEEPDSDLALDLLERHSFAAPDFIEVEVRAGLWRRARFGTSTIEQIRLAEQGMTKVIVRLLPSGEFASDAFNLALELKHPIYDCLYLAAAIRRQEQLITADRRFLNAVSASPYRDRVTSLSSFAA